MTTPYLLRAIACAALLGCGLSPVAAKNLGSFKHWHAQSFKVGGKLVCSMWSQPQTSEGNYTRRGDIFVWITHRPADKTRDRLSLEMGYPIKAKTKISVTIDDSEYLLETDKSTAWNTESAVDQRMVKAMRAGATMEVKGVSSRGTDTRDVYSLSGFTAAHKAIGKACGL